MTLLFAELHGLNKDGQRIKRGEIIFDGVSVRAEPDELKWVLREPILLPNGGVVAATTDPEQYVRSLHLQYKSPYFSASTARKRETD